MVASAVTDTEAVVWVNGRVSPQQHKQAQQLCHNIHIPCVLWLLFSLKISVYTYSMEKLDFFHSMDVLFPDYF